MAQTRGKATRAMPPRRRSSFGPFTFLLAVALLVVGLYAVALPFAQEAAVAYVTEHDTLLKQDPNPDVRQVAMIDAKGVVTAHTGSKCIPDAGQHIGATYSCQANLMSNPKIWGAMADAFEKAQGPLSERMMQALEAGEKAGGDIRGRQSAAMLIVKGQSSGKPWMDRLVDLRVEDSPEPLKELRRLLRLRMAYNKEDEGDNFIAAKNPAEALKSYAEATKLAPDVVELQFWAAVSMFTEGHEEDALKLFHQVFQKESRWIDLVPRLAQVGLFPNDPEKIKRVQAQGTRPKTTTTSMGTKSSSVIKPNK